LYVVVIIDHCDVQVVRWQVLPTTNKWVVLSCADVICVCKTFILTRDEGRKQGANWVGDELIHRNLYTKAVSHALKFAFLDKWFVFWTFFFRILASDRVHSHGKNPITALGCDEARISRSVGSTAICNSIRILHLWGWKTTELHAKSLWNRLTLRSTKVSLCKTYLRVGLGGILRCTGLEMFDWEGWISASTAHAKGWVGFTRVAIC